jgi:hypothetical protein
MLPEGGEEQALLLLEPADRDQIDSPEAINEIPHPLR